MFSPTPLRVLHFLPAASIQLCLADLCKSRHGSLGLQLTHDLLELSKCSYWLVQVELLELLSLVDFK